MKMKYDIHCHFFTKDILSKRIYSLLLPLYELAKRHNYTNSYQNHMNALQRFEEFLRVFGSASAGEVFSLLVSEYREDYLFTPLSLDLTYADDNEGRKPGNFIFRLRKELFLDIIEFAIPFLARRIKDQDLRMRVLGLRRKKGGVFKILSDLRDEPVRNSNFPEQIQELEELAQKYKNIRPFFSIDPRRYYKEQEDIVQRARAYFEKDNSVFGGFKLYAPAGFSATDPYLFSGNQGRQCLYSYCEERRIPVTVHASYGGFACLSRVISIRGDIYQAGKINSIKSGKYRFQTNFLSLRMGEAIKERAELLNHPSLWEKVLQKYPNLVINFAHFGGSTHLMEYAEYRIPFDELKNRDYTRLLSAVSVDDRSLVESCFSPRGRKYKISRDILPEKKKRLWNILYYAGFLNNWSKAIFEILRNPSYPNVYADLSCFSEGEILKGRYTIQRDLGFFKSTIFDRIGEECQGKILYGSDYALNTLFGPEMKNYIKDFRKVFGEEFDIIARVNPERFLYGNKKPSEIS